MNMLSLLEKKKHGKSLTTEEIQYFVREYQQGSIPDYQASAFLMAIFCMEMDERETTDLALAMAHSGDTISYPGIPGPLVDKHSTGGVGDKTTLLLAPMVASLGLTMPKMSGRGLGFSGGTIDKLESITGFRTELTEEEFVELVNQNKVAIMGQTQNIAPVDKKLYALRDVTGTVENISLIASSIMSKKLATATDAIVLDVKVGSGAFMRTLEDAIALAQVMQKIGQNAGKEVVAAVTNMDEPLGFAVGNALEVKEVVETLRGNGPKDLVALCILLGSHMLVLGKVFSSLEAAEKALQKTLEDGSAYQKFLVFIAAQGGDISQIEHLDTLPTARLQEPVSAEEGGYVVGIDAGMIGEISLILGAGRVTKEDVPDLAAGLVLHKKVGDYINKGDVLCVLHANDSEKIRTAKQKLLAAYAIEDTLPQGKGNKNILYALVTKEGTTHVTETMESRLIKEAWKALEKSYSPYSHFAVGAALLTKGGTLYTGCNVENAAFSPTNCAERTAFFTAIAQGETEFSAIAVVGNNTMRTEPSSEFTAPCGVCRQVMLEHCDPATFRVIVGTETGEIKTFRLDELIPHSFSAF